MRASVQKLLTAWVVTLCTAFTLFGQNDLSLSVSTPSGTVNIGDNVTFTITVNNDGGTTVSGVEVTNLLPPGVSFVSATPGAGSYNTTTHVWDIGGISSATSSVSMTLVVLVNVEGVQTLQSNITAMTEYDGDSDPTDDSPLEDDYAAACVTAPFTFCTGQTVDITASAPAGYTTYQWFKDGNPIGGATAQTYNITEAGNFSFTVDGGAVGACAGGSCCDIIVTELTPPTAGITNNTGDTELTCTLTTISLTATGGGTYLWSDVSGTTTAGLSVTDPGTYTVTVTAANGCTATSQIVITQDITPPTAGITNNDGTTEITCLQTSISLTATGGVAYTWSTSENTASISVSSAGTYTVTVTGTNGCTSTSQVVITGECTVDYGDLPDASVGGSYATMAADNGPSHGIITGLSLGATVDADPDGQPTANGDGDDNDGNNDDDGVVVGPTYDIVPGGTIRVPFTVINTTGNTAYLVAWIDWNGDGDFDDPGEMVIVLDDSGGPFPEYLEIPVPSTATTGNDIGFIIRLSNSAITSPGGYLSSGEVESYLISVNCPAQICLPVESTKN